MSSSLNYRPDIDGLRAVAVLGVLFFHAGLGFPGGYVGVDVFFVISGFLITSLLVKDLRRGAFSILDFWERRIRRIVPALAVVVLAVIAAGWFVVIPADYEVLGKQVLALIVCSSNVKFWWESGYFDTAAEEKPLLHTWSLSVEEQFYLVIPLLLAILFKLRKQSWVVPALIVGILGSFALSVYGSHHHPSATFYLLPFRAWELGFGALLAFAPPIGSRRLAHGAGWLGLAAILIPYFTYPSGIRFPGLSALPPVVGAVLLIWSGSNGNVIGPGRILATRPLVGIGLLSYSLYLWHWPIFAFQKYLFLPADRWWIQLTLAAAAFPLAWLSLRFVERPFRTGQFVRSRPVVYALGGATLASLALASLFLWKSHGVRFRLSPLEQKIAAAQFDRAFFNDHNVDDVSGTLVKFGVSGQSPTVFVWGDSHAMALLPAIDAASKAAGLTGEAATHSATAPVLDWYATAPYGLHERAPAFNRAVFRRICDLADIHPLTVVLAARWSGYNAQSHEGTSFSQALFDTVHLMREQGVDVVIVEEVPMFEFEPPRALTLGALFQSPFVNLTTTSAAHYQRTLMQKEWFTRLQPLVVRVLDPLPCYADEAGKIEPVDEGGCLWRDSHHLSTYGSMRLEPSFRRLLTTAVGDRSQMTQGASDEKNPSVIEAD